MGIDSQVEQWAIGDRSGHVFVGMYDSDPSGGGGACERFDVTPCTSLQLVEYAADPTRSAMNCEGPGAVRHMCD